MKIEFRPDFKIHPIFKAAWPKLRELFVGLKFKPENNGRTKRKIISILSAVFLAVILAIVLIKVLSGGK